MRSSSCLDGPVRCAREDLRISNISCRYHFTQPDSGRRARPAADAAADFGFETAVPNWRELLMAVFIGRSVAVLTTAGRKR